MSRKSYRVNFPGGNGYRLAGIIDRPAPDGVSRPSPPIVVFSHCFTCNKDLKAIVRISRTLSEHGIAVLRYDMTGLGGSDGDFAKTNFSTNQADLSAAIRFANTELGRVTALMGHSFGGAVSLAHAGQLSELDSAQLKAVITLAAPSDTKHLAQLLSRRDPNIEKLGRGSVTIGGIRWEIERQMLADFRGHDLPAMIPGIKAATLLFHSPHDETVNFDHALRIMGLIQNAPGNSQMPSLIALRNADHLLVNAPEDLQFVAETAAAFLHRYASSS
ncbi:MAG TPA: alpha/beta hydrolase [Rhodopirellula sp.]|nr:alpha/beta hydrolase [Rhodopirellula sp.]